MKRFKRISSYHETMSFKNNPSVSTSTARGCEESKYFNGDHIKILGFLGICLVGFSLLFSSFDGLWSTAEARIFDTKSSKSDFALADGMEKIQESTNVEKIKNGPLDGLLPAGMDEKSCLSRHQSPSYRKVQTSLPSSYLISRLRAYEALHKRCGPNSAPYNKSMEHFKLSSKTNASTSSATDCKYVSPISFSGLGNRMLTIASSFLYALLTDRVLLVDPGIDIPDLFCEPFPDTSWLLPPDFPIVDKFKNFSQKSPESFGNLMKLNVEMFGLGLPSYVYVHLVHDYDDHDKSFFCDDSQLELQKVPWLVLKTDNYFAPSFFLMPSFQEELNRLFPAKDVIFHHLSHYLFHPTNSVWGLITRYHDAYLARADERIGIQIRVFDTDPGPFKHVLDQIMACAIQENVLPKINEEEQISIASTKPKTKAVLITSLNLGYYEALRTMYWENPTLTGDVIQVFQPSHEEYEQNEKLMHNKKALAEMYLLSMTDKLVTSAWSTFGYVAQSVGGLKPWILYKSENRTAPDPPCQRAVSMEPCFHSPPHYDCRAKGWSDGSKVVDHVQNCEDMSWGLKIVS